MPRSSQFAGDVRTRQQDAGVHGHQPISTAVQQCSSWCLGSLDQCGGRVESQRKCVPGCMGTHAVAGRSPAVPRLAQLGCYLPMSFHLSLAVFAEGPPHPSCWHPKPPGMWLCRSAWPQEAQHEHPPAQSQRVPRMLPELGVLEG